MANIDLLSTESAHALKKVVDRYLIPIILADEDGAKPVLTMCLTEHDTIKFDFSKGSTHSYKYGKEHVESNIILIEPRDKFGFYVPKRDFDQYDIFSLVKLNDQ